MKEATHVWQPLRDNFKKLAPDIHLQRIENSVGNGVPDTNGCWRGREFWIELKVARGLKVELTPLQAAWLRTRALAGGNSWVLARKGDVFRLWSGDLAYAVMVHGWNFGDHALELTRPWDWRRLLWMVTRGDSDAQRKVLKAMTSRDRARRAKASPDAPLPGQQSFPGEGFPPDVAA